MCVCVCVRARRRVQILLRRSVLFEVLRGHSGLQAAAALSQLALVAVEGHLLQG